MNNLKKITRANLFYKGEFNQEKAEGHSTIIKMLPKIVKVRGCNLPGLTASLVQRTEKVAWYVRNDGYHEVFLIKIGRSFDGSELMEYYPGTNDFGKTAWCIRNEKDPSKYYVNLCLGKPIDERMAPDTY